MASQTRSAGLGANVATGSVAWNSPTNVYTSNNAYAQASLPARLTSHLLRTTTYGFTIPAGATIDGIVAEFERKSGGGLIVDQSIKIVGAGVEQGDEKSLGAGWSTIEGYVSFGGVADLWGVGWNPASINASGFGVSIAARNADRDYADDAYVDHVRITVYYSVPSTNMKINIGDVFKDVDEIKINIADAWKPVTGIWINIGDVWKKVFG